MQCLSGKDEENALIYFKEAVNMAQKALCFKAKCGSVIVANSQIIGRGYNAPPLDNTEKRYCFRNSRPQKKNYDKTCCVHAEWRAIVDALRHAPKKIINSRLYFVRVDKKGDIKKSGKPYCTVCSRLALDVGIAEFVLWHKEGMCVYNTDKYNEVSYEYKE